jgi:hypothetical protein
MKNFTFFLISISLLVGGNTSAQQVASKLKTQLMNIPIPDGVGVEQSNGQGYGSALTSATPASVLYRIGGVEHIISTPSYSNKPLPTVHFIKKNGEWTLENFYPDVTMGGGRNYVFIDSTTIVFADHGMEGVQPRPFGDVWLCKNIDNKLQWTKVSSIKSFYHSVAAGDLTNDGKFDVIGLHMGVIDGWGGVAGLHTYTQDAMGNFSLNKEMISDARWTNEHIYGQGSILIADVMGDKRPEIIEGQYGRGPKPYGLAIFQYDESTKNYQYVKQTPDVGELANSDQGTTSIKTGDFDKDGMIDLAVASEGLPHDNIQIWKGNGKGDFTPGQLLNYGDKFVQFPDSTNFFREFEVADVNSDGWLDIVVHPFHFGSKFRINPTFPPLPNSNTVGEGIMLQHSVWINQNGKFSTLKDDISYRGIKPGFMKGFKIGNELRFFGYENAMTASNPHLFKIHEVSISFCKDLVKPQFVEKQYSICGNGSTKISISNSKTGDSFQWNYAGKTESSTTASLEISQATKVSVIKTDAVGCKITSDTIVLTKLVQPATPSITVDANKMFVSSASFGNSWYKDGVALKDTAQKIKPVAAGFYSVMSTLNSCSSSMSASTFFIGENVLATQQESQLSASPNPFTTQIRIDFPETWGKSVKIKLMNSAGAQVFAKENVSNGEMINLSFLANGTYILQINANVELFKHIKLIKAAE